MEQLKEFQKKIGYQFQQEGLLRQALTHSSYANEHKMNRIECNERLEFLGDAILDAIVGDIVYKRFEGKREGFLTNTRSKIAQQLHVRKCF